MRVLVITIGGSVAPVVKSIKNYHPDIVVFLCTEDDNGNKGSRIMIDGGKDSVVEQCGLSGQDYLIHVVPHDDPNTSFAVAYDVIKEYISEGHEVIVDYTGGTKSMSVGLAVAAMEFPQCGLSVVKGVRQDLVRIRDGMERVSRLPSYAVFAQRQEKLCRNLISNWDYAAAVQILEELSAQGFVSNEKEFERLLILCRSFSAWDKFDYQQAVEIISYFKSDPLVTDYNATLKQICATLEWSREWTPGKKSAPPRFLYLFMTSC